MTGIFAKLRSLTIATQIGVLVVTALLIANACFFALYPLLRPTSEARTTTARLIFVAKLVGAAASPAQRAEIIRITRADIPGLKAGEMPVGARPLKRGPQAEDIRAELGNGFTGFELPPKVPELPHGIAIRFPDGTALMAPNAQPPGVSGQTRRLVVTVVSLASVVTLLSIWAARALTAPLKRFADAAERFTLGRADEPLPECGPREVVQAARAFNGMRERIQRMVEDRARMLAAISHDLRTPIARLRLRAEAVEPVTLRQQVIRDLDTMQAMARATLSFLRDQVTRGTLSTIDLPSLIQTVCDGFGDAGQEVAFEAPTHIRVKADSDQLSRAISNLIENGLKFGSSVIITVRERSDGIVDIDVQDDGPGIPEAEKLRVLEPFYRSDHARSLNGQDSFGLGLSISRLVAEAHSGSLTLHDAKPSGLIARLTLPKVH
jgi:signal transduction histidine kinase